jgi:Tol biopolymer transport system component
MIRRTMLGVATMLLASGCAGRAAPTPPAPPAGESEVLGNVIQLTSGFARAGEAYFSPDMNWVIFQATPQGEEHYAMYVARTRRQGDQIVALEPPIRISPPGSRNTCGDFSPDGRSILFASTAGQEDPQVPGSGYQRQGRDYRWSFPDGMDLFRADNWQAAVANADAARGLDLAQHRLASARGYDAEGSFSPDGKWIVFSSTRDDQPAAPTPTPDELMTTRPTTAPARRPNLELYVMRSDGSSVVRLTNIDGYDGGPFFSPDGKRIVYRSDRLGNDLLQVYVADLVFDARGDITGIIHERKLTDDANVNWGPFWHPGGRHIVYATSVHGHANYELYLMRDDGSAKTRLTFTPGADVLPVFSPDGRYLLWTSKRTSDNTTQLFLATFTMPASAE